MARQFGKTTLADQIYMLRQIWLEEGVNPAYHRAQQERLKKEWPLLYNFMVNTFGPPGTKVR